MRQIFYNHDLNSSFLRNGFVVVDLLTSDQIDLLQKLYDREQFQASGDFYLTIWKDSPLHRQMIHDQIQQIISHSYLNLLFKYKPIINSFAVKRSSPDSRWHPHQDDTFVDESRFTSVSIWVPLIATNAANGTMSVLPGSHDQYTGPRSPNIPQPFKNDLKSINSGLVDVELGVGQAIIFDHRLIHGSGENKSGKERVAIVSVLIPEEAGLTYLYLDKQSSPNMIRQYQISERYYLEAPLGEFSIEPNSPEFSLVASYPFDDKKLI